MAKTRGWLADRLSRMGNRIFRLLSGCEEKGIFPRASNWLKLGVLGLVVSIVGSLSATEPIIKVMCYDMVRIPDAYVTELSVKPNPTNGADSVTVRAHAAVSEENPEETIITRAAVQFNNDTLFVSMQAEDGEFDEAEEKLVARVSVEALEPGTTWVNVTAVTSEDGMEAQGIRLIVNEPDSTHSGDQD